jgi:hypothetical protein
MRMRPSGRKRRQQQEAEGVFTPEPITRHAGPPASNAPVRDYLATPRPGADTTYVVVPRSLAEAMPLPWQQHLTYLLSEFHQAFSHVAWPTYRVVPSRYEKLTDLDEDQLAEVGCLVEIDAAGEVVYRDRSGRLIDNPAETTVLVSVLDPIPPPKPGQSQPGQPPQNAPQPGPLPPNTRQAPPQAPQRQAPQQHQQAPQQPSHQQTPQHPVQDRIPERRDDLDQPDTPPTGFPMQNPAPIQPGQPFGPTGYQQRRPGGYRDRTTDQR